MIVIQLVVVIFALATSVEAKTMTADSSAVFSSQKSDENKEYFIRKQAMRNVLTRRNSVLADHVDSFLEGSETYDLDPYLLVSISGLESSFGKAMIDGSYNAYGWGGGYIYFKNWDDGIMTISKALREKYYDRGATTLAAVGRRYSESATWTVRVNGFMNQFYTEETKVRAISEFL